MAAGDLTTLANVRGYLPATDVGDPAQDAVLSRLITAVSQRFTTEVGRQFGTSPVTCTEVRNGNGKNHLTPRFWPVTSVASITVDGATIPPQSGPGQSGWALVEDTIYLVGYLFTEAIGNVTIVYQAGTGTVPADVEQAIIKMVGLQFSDRKRVGLNSLSMGGQSASFNDGPVLAYWTQVVKSYRCNF